MNEIRNTNVIRIRYRGEYDSIKSEDYIRK